MGHIVIETLIRAPRSTVFDFARDVGAHNESASFSRERVVAPGRTSGLLELGDLATFEGTHFGLRQSFTLKIVEMEPPVRFVDELVRSAFRRMRHIHEFEWREEGTLMRDTLDWECPFGIVGRFADALVIERHLRSFVTRKQLALKRTIESLPLNLDAS